MEQQNQPAPVAPAPQAPVSQAPTQPAPAPQAKSTPVWVWLLGGCLGLVILTMIAIGGFTWWAAKKVKQEFKAAQPKLEQWQEDAEKMSKEAEEWQKEMEKLREQMPEVPADYGASLE